MIVYDIHFDFEGTTHKGSVFQLNDSPTKRQFHVTPFDEDLRNRFGTQMVFWDANRTMSPYEFGLQADRNYMRSVAEAVMSYNEGM